MYTLDDPSQIPEYLLRPLSAEKSAFERSRYLDHLLENPRIRSVAVELDRVVTLDEVRGYHCSKVLSPGAIASRGLRTLSIDQHLAEFFDLIAVEAPQLMAEFERVYSEWQKDPQMKGREGRICFCMSRDLVLGDGTERFFKYYGGEALYWPLDEDSACLAFLESVGQPVVVEVSMPARDLVTFSQLPFARSLLGYYARQINSEFQPEPIETQVTRPVLASEIVAVHSLDSFRGPAF